MAFSFGNSGNASGAGGLSQGSDLEVIQTEGLGFLSVAGDARVQLTPKWPSPPSPTASLLSIASRKGIVAAAGPDAVHIATTESVRKAFESPKNGESEARPFQPQRVVTLPMRISQLAFTADEQYLILSAESGGGLAIYDVQALNQGSNQAAFELSTNGETLRQLVPNPMPDHAAFCAVVTDKGNLLMANLQERTLVSGASGPVLRTQVTCAAWSTKGKQLVAGRADGTVVQMTPDGTEKALIPKPPSLGDYHVSSITWVENHVFLVVHSVASGQQPAIYHLITRHQQPGAGAPPPTFTFQKLADPVEPFTFDKAPHHTVLRLHHFPPNLDDLLIVASTAIENIGLVSRSKTPLASNKPADKITNVFTTTELADDSRRAQLPMSEDLNETFPVGTALDLSSKDKVYKPIPTDEMDQSPGPLPGLWVLNNEGVLSVWWIVYNESIRAGTTYPGLAAVDQQTGAAEPASAFATPKPFGASASGKPAFGAPSTAAPAFGAPSALAPAFGTPSAAKPAPFGSPAAATPAFGGASVLGAKSNPWATPASTTAAPAFGSSTFGSTPAASAPKFGAPSFGSSPFGGKTATPAFGQPSTALGAKVSPWAAGSAAGATPAFGQSTFGAPSTANTSKVFGSPSGATPAASGGGFSAFANKGGFGSLGGGTNNSTSIFGKPSAGPASTTEISMDTDTAFPPPGSKPQGGSAFGASPFVLGTTFKADPKTANDNEPAKQGGGGSLFGRGFGLSLTEPAKSEAKDEDMDATTPAVQKPKSIFESTTPTTTPAPAKFGFTSTSGPSNGPSIFGAPKPAVTPFANPFAPKPAVQEPPKQEEPKIKEEEEADKENMLKIPAAPLPPDTTSKAAFNLGDSSASSSARSEYSPVAVSKTPSKEAGGDAPLPPDFLAKPKGEDAPLPPDFTKQPAKKAADEAPLPPDFLSSKTEQKLKLTDQVPEEAPLPPDPVPAKTPAKNPFAPDYVPPKNPWAKQTPAVPEFPEFPELTEEGEFSDENDEDGEGEDDVGESEEEAESYDEEGAESEEQEEDRTEAGSEGSGIDVAKDLSPQSNASGRTPAPGFTPQSSFNMAGGSAFSSFSHVEQPQRSLFGEIGRNAPPLFPKTVPQSPRSPSPVRGAIPPNLLRPEASRSVSAPGMASQILGRQAAAKTQTQVQPPPSFGKANRSSIMLDPNVELQRKLMAKKEEEAAQLLRDPEDEGIQQLLEVDIEPTLRIDEFVAVDTQLPEIASRENEPIHVQCEALWRDINRMIDRIGLNSLALQSFIKGQTEMFKEAGRRKQDLDKPDDWVLVEADDLGVLVDGELTQELEDGRVKDVDGTKETVKEMLRDITKLRAKQDDMRKLIMSNIDPDQATVTKSLPLTAEQATQQNELRRAYANVTTLLSEAEEAVTMLRAKIASAGGAMRKNGGAPTVDAVIRTINKMTTMAEKRSADVDVLESQMRRLRVGTPGRGSPSPRSREGSPFVGGGTPAARRSLLMSPGAPLRDSLASSVASYDVGVKATPPRKKMSMFTEEETQAVQTKQAKRKAKLGMLRESLERAGPHVSTLRDED